MHNIFSYLKAIKSKPKYLFGIFLITLILIFVPGPISIKFGLYDIVNKYRVWLGIISTAYLCLLLIHLAFFLRCQYKEYKNHNKILKRLSRLSEKEKEYLLWCVNNNQQSFVSTIADGTAQSLVQKKLLDTKRGDVNLVKYPI